MLFLSKESSKLRSETECHEPQLTSLLPRLTLNCSVRSDGQSWGKTDEGFDRRYMSSGSIKIQPKLKRPRYVLAGGRI